MTSPSQPVGDNRREFIRGSSLLLASALPTSAAGDRPLRIGLLGCGQSGIRLIRELSLSDQHFQLAALSDAFPDRLQQSARALKSITGERYCVGRDQRYVGMRSFQQICSAELDLLVIASPVPSRPIHLEAALSSGVPFFVEQPVVWGEQKHPKLIEDLAQAERANQSFVVRCRPIPPGIEGRLDEIRQGSLGALHSIQAWLPKPELDSQKSAQQADWDFRLRNWHHFAKDSRAATATAEAQVIGIAREMLSESPIETTSSTAGGCVRKSNGSDSHVMEYDHGTLCLNYWPRKSNSRSVELRIEGSAGSVDLKLGKPSAGRDSNSPLASPTAIDGAPGLVDFVAHLRSGRHYSYWRPTMAIMQDLLQEPQHQTADLG